MLGTSSVNSFTGKFLYSDYIHSSSPPEGIVLPIKSSPDGGAFLYKSLGNNVDRTRPYTIRIFKKQVCKYPLLNRIAAIPILGSLAGVIRIVLSIIHIIGHLFLAIWDKEHIPHVIKGGCELLRGMIELLPLIGNVWTWYQDHLDPIFSGGEKFFGRDYQRYYFRDDKTIFKLVDSVRARFFIYKVVNPKKFDHIDELFGGPCVDQYYFDKEMTQPIEMTDQGEIHYTVRLSNGDSFEGYNNLRREWPSPAHEALFGPFHDGNYFDVDRPLDFRNSISPESIQIYIANA